MTVTARYKWLREQAAISDPVRLAHKPIRSWKQATHATESLSIAYDDWIRLAMCEWRHNLRDPRDSLRVANQAAVRAASILERYQPSKSILLPFWFPPAAYTTRFQATSFDHRILAMLPDFRKWRSTNLSIGYCDAGHMIAIHVGEYPSDWPELLASFLGEKGRELFCDTHRCYANIICSALADDFPGTLRHIQTACDLFQLREDDEFFIDSQLPEGGGPGNAYSVDYRLAALLFHFFPNQPEVLAPVAGFHLWRF